MSQLTVVIILESVTLVAVGGLLGGAYLAVRRAKRELNETRIKLDKAKLELRRFLTALESL